MWCITTQCVSKCGSGDVWDPGVGWVGVGRGGRGWCLLSLCASSKMCPQTDSKQLVIFDKIGSLASTKTAFLRIVAPGV